MRFLLSAFLILLMSAGVVSEGVAGSLDDPVVVLHANYPVTPKAMVTPLSGISPYFGCTTRDPLTQRIPCSEFATTWPSFEPSYVYLFVAQADSGDGVGGVALGIEGSQDVGIFGWILCADEDVPSSGWPASGSGNRILWDTDANCQRTVLGTDGAHAMAGSFYVYAYGSATLTVVHHPTATPPVETVSCNGVGRAAAPGARIGFDGALGFNPCLAATPVQPSTWGRIKNATRAGDR